MVRFLLMLMAFINTLGTVLGVVYLFRYIFYPYNYLLALAHKLYKGDSNFSTKGEFMSYAFKGKYGWISFVFTMINILITQNTGLLFPVLMLFVLFVVFGVVIGLPLPKKLRTETYPKPTWKSYIFLIIPITVFYVVMLAYQAKPL